MDTLVEGKSGAAQRKVEGKSQSPIKYSSMVPICGLGSHSPKGTPT